MVVSPTVLAEKEIYIREPITTQQFFRDMTEDHGLVSLDVLSKVMRWHPNMFREPRESEILNLADLQSIIKPTKIIRNRNQEPLLYVFWCDEDMDATPNGSKWRASYQIRVERHLNRMAPHIGIHASRDMIRLCYAPPGQAPGTLGFPVEFMQTAEGRILIDALFMLLGMNRLYRAEEGKTLLDILKDSRNTQDRVTEELAKQIEEALRHLIEGFDAANQRSDGVLLKDFEPIQIYNGLTDVLLRMVFLLYAEDKALLPTDNELYNRSYSIAGLGAQLEEEYVFHSASMDQRFGAWGRLLVLFRLVYMGSAHEDLYMPPRQGTLFNPSLHPFLDGRKIESIQKGEILEIPKVDDLCLYNVFRQLRYLNGQALSYRNLEVEQIGSVYEALMGFSMERAKGTCVSMLPDRVVVSLHELRNAKNIVTTLNKALGQKALHKTLEPLKEFKKSDDVGKDVATLYELLKPRMSGGKIPSSHHYLQSSPGRRWSGSHYTPRSLSEPIVEKTLAPILGQQPSPEKILSIKVCDPAMGSAAFLASACRYLASCLVEAWGRTQTQLPNLKEKDIETHARRVVAERCLYGVDKNPRAVQLARLSMWIVTAARDQPFTFLDHALKHGDAVVGCFKNQIAHFSFDGKGDMPLFAQLIQKSMDSSIKHRAKILSNQLSLQFGEQYKQKSLFLDWADEDVEKERKMGDLLIECVWAGGSNTEKKKRIQKMRTEMTSWYTHKDQKISEEAQNLLNGLTFKPFHWELEFPEVFSRKESGFDAVVGNPPFAGKNTTIESNGDEYINVLKQHWLHSHGKSDLCAYFFLRSEEVLHVKGCFGLIATNSIDQGNTRHTGLQYLVNQKGVEFYSATIDMTWPVAGAAVVVSIIHGSKERWKKNKSIDGTKVSFINSELEDLLELPDPVSLLKNEKKSHQGSIILGMGFTMSPSERHQLIQRDNHNSKLIYPYLGGQELNSSPTLSHHRYVINFGERTLEEAEEWPDLIQIVREKVKPERDISKGNDYKKWWWHFGRKQLSLYRTIKPLERCLACAVVTKHLMFAFQPTDRVYSAKLIIFPFDNYKIFAILQSQIHEPWAWKFSSTMKNDLSYSPSSCFRTFPFPSPTTEQDQLLESTGKALYETRSAYMIKHQVGMTETWNRLKEENNPHYHDDEIKDIRAKRLAMDKAVLAAYGWEDLEPTDSKNIIARLRKLNAERAKEEVEAVPEAVETALGESRKIRSTLLKIKEAIKPLSEESFKEITTLITGVDKTIKTMGTSAKILKNIAKKTAERVGGVDEKEKEAVHNAHKKFEVLHQQIQSTSQKWLELSEGIRLSNTQELQKRLNIF